MDFTMVANQSQRFVLEPVQADLKTSSKAILSSIVLSSADTSLVDISPDPTNPNGVIVSGKGNPTPGTLVSAKATATEPDGTTTETITGSLNVILSPVPPPPPPPPAPPAAAILFVPVGTPTP